MTPTQPGGAAARYTATAIALHWIIAFLFLAVYASVYYRRWMTEKQTPENWTALQIHLAVGVSIAAFVALRIVWRAMNKPPELPPGSRLEHLAAHGAHWALYAFMIVMPITGYLGTSVATEYFDIPKFEDTWVFKTLVEGYLGLTFKEFEAPMDYIHKNSGAYVVWVLIALHAAAALYHHYLRRDTVLLRMLPKR